MKKIAVTGAGGFIGRALTHQLLAEGHEVLALDNDSRGNLDTLSSHERLSSEKLDVLDFNMVLEKLRGIDSVFHLAAINGTENFYKRPAKVLEVGLIGTHNVVKACLENSVKEFFFASSSEVYNNPPQIPTPEEVPGLVPEIDNPRFSYGGGKLAGELIVHNYFRGTDTRYVIFRPHNVFGPQMGYEHVIPQFIGKMLNARRESGVDTIEIEIQGEGSETRAFIYVDDAALGISRCCLGSKESGVYHVGQDSEVSIKDLAFAVADSLGLNLSLRHGIVTKGSPSRRCPNISKLRSLGFEAKYTFSEGLQKTVEWYRKDYEKRHGN